MVSRRFPARRSSAGDPAFIGEAIGAVMAITRLTRNACIFWGTTLAAQWRSDWWPIAGSVFGDHIVSALMCNSRQGRVRRTDSPYPFCLCTGRESELYPVDGAEPQPRLASRRLSAADTVDFWRKGTDAPLRQAQPAATAASFSKLSVRDGGCVCRCPGRKPGLVRIGDDIN